MVDSIKYREWFKMAERDLKSAEILYEHDADNGIVCFHCQQAIEKGLKGFLIKVTGKLQEGHNLVRLCKKAMAYKSELGDFIKDMAFVNAYYIETRYPAEDFLEVSNEDANECITIANRVLKKIDSFLDDNK